MEKKRTYKILRIIARLNIGGPALHCIILNSELDPGRNAQLFETLASDAGQCVLTTTAPEFIRLPQGVERALIGVAGGRLTPS